MRFREDMRWPSSRLFAIAALAALTLANVSAITEEEAESDRGYESEKRGVNPYTAPSIAQIFQRLDELRPLPFEQLKRDFAAGGHGSREQLGMVFGGLIGDGFLVVECERKNLVDELGRALLRQARSLGVKQRVMRHSASLTELGRRGDWPAMRRELSATQNDVEHAMIELHDRKLAHLISLGGWLRGLEICSAAVSENYTRERAKALIQPELLEYFADELRSLPAAVVRTPVFGKIQNGISALRAIEKKAPGAGLAAADVKAINAQAQEMNAALQRD